eukprot:scaffold156_cov33-Attheya_sp.AAC.3
MVKGISRPGTATNKASAGSTLQLPRGERLRVEGSMGKGMPFVHGKWDHEAETDVCTNTHVNMKGGVDSHVLKYILVKLVAQLYPDICDVCGMPYAVCCRHTIKDQTE